jgi:hypothetical protein
LILYPSRKEENIATASTTPVPEKEALSLYEEDLPIPLLSASLAEEIYHYPA